MELTLENVLRVKTFNLEEGEYELKTFNLENDRNDDIFIYFESTDSFYENLYCSAGDELYNITDFFSITKEQCLDLIDFENQEILKRLINSEDIYTEAEIIIKEYAPVVAQALLSNIKDIGSNFEWV